MNYLNKVEPKPGQSDGSGSSQIPRLRLRNPGYNICIKLLMSLLVKKVKII